MNNWQFIPTTLIVVGILIWLAYYWGNKQGSAETQKKADKATEDRVFKKIEEIFNKISDIEKELKEDRKVIYENKNEIDNIKSRCEERAKRIQRIYTKLNGKANEQN